MSIAANNLSRKISVVALVLLLAATTLAVPLHQASHGPVFFAQGEHRSGGQGALLLGPEVDAGHLQWDEVCAICQGFTRIAGTLPAVSSTGLELTAQSGTTGSAGTIHSIGARQDFQRGPPRKGAPEPRG